MSDQSRLKIRRSTSLMSSLASEKWSKSVDLQALVRLRSASSSAWMCKCQEPLAVLRVKLYSLTHTETFHRSECQIWQRICAPKSSGILTKIQQSSDGIERSSPSTKSCQESTSSASLTRATKFYFERSLSKLFRLCQIWSWLSWTRSVSIWEALTIHTLRRSVS